MTLLKNTKNLSMFIKYIKNGILTDNIWNIMDLSSMSNLIYEIDEVLYILDKKFVDSIVILSSCIEIFSCCNAFS